ncbi:MAG: hypothetical protein Kow0084_00740 [Pseudothermotoga elfii]
MSPIQGFWLIEAIIALQNADISIIPSIPMFIVPVIELSKALIVDNIMGVDTLRIL